MILSDQGSGFYFSIRVAYAPVMSRPLRLSYPGAIYHVTARGNERKRIARDDQDREWFLAMVGDMVEQHQVQCHAWVVMDNHYHPVIETTQANLSSAILHLNL